MPQNVEVIYCVNPSILGWFPSSGPQDSPSMVNNFIPLLMPYSQTIAAPMGHVNSYGDRLVVRPDDQVVLN